MASDGEKLGEGVMEQNGTKYAPLKAALTALGGTAEFDGKKTWTVKYNDTETTVTTNGKFKIDGKHVKGDDFTVWLDEEKDRFYIFRSGACADHRQKLYRSRRRCVRIHDALARRSGQPENLSRLAAQRSERRGGRRYSGGGRLYRADLRRRPDRQDGQLSGRPDQLSARWTQGARREGDVL